MKMKTARHHVAIGHCRSNDDGGSTRCAKSDAKNSCSSYDLRCWGTLSFAEVHLPFQTIEYSTYVANKCRVADTPQCNHFRITKRDTGTLQNWSSPIQLPQIQSVSCNSKREQRGLFLMQYSREHSALYNMTTWSRPVDKYGFRFINPSLSR